MPAYVISDVEFLDPEFVAQYRTLAATSIATYDGRYVVRGGAIELVEGDWLPKNIVIVEFPSMERALKRRLIFVEGLPA